MSVAEEIKRLHELQQAGALSDEEFAAAKARLLNNQAAPATSNDISRLRRSRTDRWLGGVCGGLGRITGVDSWIWRLLFVLFVLTFGFGLALYILLWIFVPEDELIGN
ncbi:phage shock protein PspC (stress-responsive transcriptional regulator) [Duganella sp. SG902]|uniref:PspC domain-containing protein n=1 Tax=Duganella sp. SG902 TaxID=2587016 RepID=UPI00159CF35A|nr:PspC domain-containing protein [Duganella sp. SG902]NVM77940.1 phage shock protein PspC (stress-responsive transcriptional regulator) [Duganella sp. SG902]